MCLCWLGCATFRLYFVRYVQMTLLSPLRTISDWAKEMGELPSRARRYVAVVEVAAVGGLVVAGLTNRWRVEDIATFGALIVLSLVGFEAFRRVGSSRGRQDRPYYDPVTIFFLAAVLLLPPFYGGALALSMTPVEQTLRTRLPVVKRAFNASMYAVTCLAVSGMHQAVGGPLKHADLAAMAQPRSLAALGAAMALFIIVNEALVFGVVRRVAPETSWKTLLIREKWVHSVADVSSGAMVATAWTVSPVLVLPLLAPILLLQRAVVHTHLLEMANSDSKTGLANPAWWRQESNRILVRARQTGVPVALFVLDLDRFKAINDRYGHLVGDAILAGVGEVLGTAVAGDDVAGRFGGEEFVALVTGTDASGAAELAERVRRDIAAIRYRPPKEPDTVVTVTASVGVALLGRDGEDIDELLAAADAAMYRAKGAGRNRVEIAEPQAPAAAPAPAPVTAPEPERLTPS